MNFKTVRLYVRIKTFKILLMHYGGFEKDNCVVTFKMIRNCYMMVRSFRKRIVLVTFFAYTTICAIASPLENGQELEEVFPGSYEQEIELAGAVCADLGLIQLSICRKRFLEEHGTFGGLPLPPELQIKCRSEESITFLTTPTTHWQLVVLVNDDNDKEIINYRLIDGSTNVGMSTIYTGKLTQNYTLWTTILDATGNHSAWRRGPEVPSWDEVSRNLEKKQYDIQVEFLLDRYVNGSYVEAKFSWNSSDDSCFRVHNSCNKKTLGNLYEKEIKPDDATWVIVEELPLDDDCTFTVRGRHGRSELAYRTPACHLLPGCQPPPEAVENLYISASEDTDGLWVVEVMWSEPRYPQDFYNVTLRAERTQTIILPGDSTGVSFKGVAGEGLYSVYVTSVMANRTAVASQSAIFPAARAQGPEGLLVGAAWSTLLLAVLATVALFWYRRRQQDKRQGQYYASIQEMSTKLSSAESGYSSGTGAGGAGGAGGADGWELQRSRLALHEVLGEGAFGVVRRATLAPSGTQVAVKMLKEFPSSEEVRAFRSEMEVMKSVGAHAHVVSLLGCCAGRRPLLVVEFCARGDLLSYLRLAWDAMVSKRSARYCSKEAESRRALLADRLAVNRLYELTPDDLTLPDLISFCRQIAKGMEFLAANRVVHRDLAARNVLVAADRTLKIADFGLSRDVYQDNHYKQSGNGKMPLKWMAIESITHRVYTTQSDVWSFGVVMWEVLTLGGAPYAALDGARLPRLLRAGYRLPRPHNADAQLYELMLSCWAERARSRPTFAQLHARLDALLAARAHPYLPLTLPAPPPAPEPVAPPAPPAPTAYRYVRMLFRNDRMWGRGRSYEWPTYPAKRNHYSPRPAALL